ncbi:zinc finger MYM-type protein 1-like, partial [Aphis craccivora]
MDSSEKRKNTIVSYFQKKSRSEPLSENNETLTAIPALEHVQEQDISSDNKNSRNLNIKNTENVCLNKFDIGLFNRFTTKQIDSEQIYQILTNTWYPEPSYQFIATGKRNLKFQYKWLDRWKWLAYSKSQNGVYCKYCISFSPEEVCSQKLGKFVLTKFDDWAHAIDKFNEHQKNKYHLTAISKVDGFLSVFNKKQNNIAVQLDNNLKLEIEQNKQILRPIIETIILCGSQGLALRGHRDSGHFQPDELYSAENDGNFRAFLRYRVSGGDLILKNHLQNCKKNAMYTSPEFQNEIIDTIYHIIINKLVCKINQSKCYTVLADETCDISGVEQFSLCVRYFDKETKTLREDFLKFVPVLDVSGKGLAK